MDADRTPWVWESRFPFGAYRPKYCIESRTHDCLPCHKNNLSPYLPGMVETSVNNLKDPLS